MGRIRNPNSGRAKIAQETHFQIQNAKPIWVKPNRIVDVGLYLLVELGTLCYAAAGYPHICHYDEIDSADIGGCRRWDARKKGEEG